MEIDCPNANMFEIAVQDPGVGVAPEHRDKLFTQFFRAYDDTAISGMGLGLYISRQIIELHGGDLRAEFSGSGTRFVIQLPVG